MTGLSRRVGWSAPLLLVLAGVGIAFIPGVPTVQLNPEVVLVGVLPAVLFAAALQTSFLEVRARGDSILTLSVGLVVFSALVVGIVTWLLVPEMTFAAGIAFGAILAPTDAVSVGAIAGSGKLPRRLAALLEGEGLLNDATALVTLNSAIAAIGARGHHRGRRPGLHARRRRRPRLRRLVAVGLTWIRRRLKAPVLDTSLSLAAPYIAYLPASWCAAPASSRSW